jgi:peptidyl-dipeptidase Dcp
VNPLLAEWSGPHGGVPPFDRVAVEHFAPALEAAMAGQLAEIERIAQHAAAPSFENTLAALERSGRSFDRASRIFNVFRRTMSSAGFQAVEREMAPKMAAFRDRIVQNEKLFERIAGVFDAREGAALTPEQKRLAWLKRTEFLRSGAGLKPPAKQRLSELNQQLAVLYSRFGQNVLADESGGVILNTRSSVEPFLTYSDHREQREKVWRRFVSRGDNDDAHDNKRIVAEIVKLRAERARLLGYPSHAHWRLEMSMAKTPERAMALLEAVWKPALARVAEELADMRALAPGITLEPWDYRYYAEKVRKAKYDVDENEVKPYLQLEQLREAMFWVAGELWGLEFSPLAGLPVYHPDVRVWEVRHSQRGHAGLFYFDPYARPGKISGAWMNAYRSQERFDGEVTPIVSNNANFVKAPAGEPVLVSWDDARTLFHEFGHALHGLSSSVDYPSLAGTSVDLDYVEFPSQLLESWLLTPEVLKRYARHQRTGEPIPDPLVAKLARAAKFNQGFDTVEYLACALVDMRLHLAAEPSADIGAFEREALAGIGMPKEIAMRHRLPHFNHLFTGDGYSAGYYSYLWADTLSADAFEAFTTAAGPYDKAVAQRLREHVLRAGNTVDPAEGYRAFRGRDPTIDALMRKRGFPC